MMRAFAALARLAILALAVWIFIVAITSIGSSSPSSPPAAVAQATSTPAPPGFDTATGVQLTVSQEHTDSGGWYGAGAGKVYLVLRVTLHNKGKDSASYNPLDFSLQGNADHISSAVEFFDLGVNDTPLHAGELRPSHYIAGDVAFKVSATTKQAYTLDWQPNVFRDPIELPIPSR